MNADQAHRLVLNVATDALAAERARDVPAAVAADVLLARMERFEPVAFMAWRLALGCADSAGVLTLVLEAARDLTAAGVLE